MHQFNYFDLIIFDCDGVILNTNELKIEAMGAALEESGVTSPYVKKCKSFFSANFGKSRFYHVDYFIENILNINKEIISQFKKKLLDDYSRQCKQLYLSADMTPLVDMLLKKNKTLKYVASGSEQTELREVFFLRKLDKYFENVFGSPEKKHIHVSRILDKHKKSKAVVIGDAVTDLEAANKNGIDFIFYSPFSKVEDEMRKLCKTFNYRVIDSFKEIIEEI